VAPSRLGNVHPSIEPFSTYAAADGPMMICAGNDRHFASLAQVLGVPELADDDRYASNGSRVENREALRAEIEAQLAKRPVADWVEDLSFAGVPAGPVNDIEGGFALAESLGLTWSMRSTASDKASPIKLARMPETRVAPPSWTARARCFAPGWLARIFPDRYGPSRAGFPDPNPISATIRPWT
jgi:crotonobetainyl-CoA:carnitine CoA-transferase CaiB-like acyl-CoA transferase